MTGALARRSAAMLLLAGTLAGCSGASVPSIPGYVEGDFVRIAPEAGGRLIALSVERGGDVGEGGPLFALDDRDEKAALAEAEAERAAAAANLADLTTGKRAEEISVFEANLAEAEAERTAAEQAYVRNQALETRNVASAAALDQAKATLDAATARVDAATRTLAVAKMPARPDLIDAARQSLVAREAVVTAAKTRLSRRSVASPVTGRVADTYFRVGEIVPAGSPVVALLPPENRKIVFFLPEPQRSAVHPGLTVALGCDGCATGLAATVSSIATEAEFAPPVIYSTGSRAKLVYRVEARPNEAALALEPGQPLDVTLSSGAP